MIFNKSQKESLTEKISNPKNSSNNEGFLTEERTGVNYKIQDPKIALSQNKINQNTITDSKPRLQLIEPIEEELEQALNSKSSSNFYKKKIKEESNINSCSEFYSVKHYDSNFLDDVSRSNRGDMQGQNSSQNRFGLTNGLENIDQSFKSCESHEGDESGSRSRTPSGIPKDIFVGEKTLSGFHPTSKINKA